MTHTQSLRRPSPRREAPAVRGRRTPRAAQAATGYPLRIDSHELARLDRQGRALAPATRFILASAGITAGMRVLDLGSGAGDTAFVAAELVGPSGQVVGLDRSAAAVDRATERARTRGLGNVTFRVGDIHDGWRGPGTFDAVIGRLVLMYAADPAAVLRRQACALAPGGIVAAVEFDVLNCRSVPTVPLVEEFVTIVREAFRRAGVELSLGPQLWQVLAKAGLQSAGMVAIQPHFGPGDPDGSGLLAAILRSSAPLVERTGVATAQQLGVDTYQQRLRTQLTAAGAVLGYPAFYGAWATTSAGSGQPRGSR